MTPGINQQETLSQRVHKMLSRLMRSSSGWTWKDQQRAGAAMDGVQGTLAFIPSPNLKHPRNGPKMSQTCRNLPLPPMVSGGCLILGGGIFMEDHAHLPSMPTMFADESLVAIVCHCRVSRCPVQDAMLTTILRIPSAH